MGAVFFLVALPLPDRQVPTARLESWKSTGFNTGDSVRIPAGEVKAEHLFYPFWGSGRTLSHFAAPGAWAMSTPFKWVKQVAFHFGGTASVFVFSHSLYVSRL